MVNRGEEKVKVHMNVVSRSTMNNADFGLSFISGSVGFFRFEICCDRNLQLRKEA